MQHRSSVHGQRRAHHPTSTPRSSSGVIVNARPVAMATATTDTKNNTYPRANNGYAANPGMYSNMYGSRGHAGQNYGMHPNSAADMAALTHGFQGMNLANQQYAAQAKNAMMSTAAGNYAGLSVSTAMPTSMYAAMGQYAYPSAYGANTAAQNQAMYTPHVQQYMPQLGYQGYQQHDHSPLSQNWTPTTGVTGEVPTLITPRRDSISSNENDQPATPSYAGYSNFAPAGGVAINRSPSGVFTHSTPSPTSMIGPYGMPIAKLPEQSDVPPHVKELVSRHPPIPRAIPAPSSPLKPLDRALENQRGETNVYIRGLLPETTDEILEAWGTRFGDIKSSKSIIDMNNGLCKGYASRRHSWSTSLTLNQVRLCEVSQLRRRRELHPWLPLLGLRSQLRESECCCHHSRYVLHTDCLRRSPSTQSSRPSRTRATPISTCPTSQSR